MADVWNSHYLQGSGKLSKEAASLEEAPISYQGWIPEFDGDGQHGPLRAKYLAELSLEPNTLGFRSLGCCRIHQKATLEAPRKHPWEVLQAAGHSEPIKGKELCMEETALPPPGCPSTLSSDIQPAGKGENFTGSSSTIPDKTTKNGFGAERQSIKNWHSMCRERVNCIMEILSLRCLWGLLLDNGS